MQKSVSIPFTSQEVENNSFLNRLAESSCVLPIQLKPDLQLTPEHLLMLAMIQEAVLDLQKKVRQVRKSKLGASEKGKRLYKRETAYRLYRDKKSALNWINEIEDEDNPITFFSFTFCCESLGANPNVVRKNILSGNLKIESNSIKTQRPLAKVA
jgi:hypothetical protein